jgi:hypothetical protein
MTLPMPFARSRRFATRRFAWLLWLGLLLPVAQLAAATHALSHARLASSRDDPHPQAPHVVHCDLCLIAASVGGAAPAAAGATFIAPTLPSSLPEGVIAAPRAAVTVLAYRSRAPPVLAS